MSKPANSRSRRRQRAGRRQRPGRGQPGALLVQAARRFRDIIAECAQAQRRLTELSTAPDRYLLNPDQAPDTYQEFLYRTSSLMRHEPTARARASR